MERERREDAQQRRRRVGEEEERREGRRRRRIEMNCVKTFAEGGDESERVNRREAKERRAITEGEGRVGGERRDQSPTALLVLH